MFCVLVTHTHWDREWYRTFQAFRARLVDTIDSVLELIQRDPGFHFLLDGQTIVIEDYLEIRPQRRGDIEAACRAGRIAIGPWYVQPDSLLPSGEAHVRNLLEGRRVGTAIGPVSRIAYCPDSFGHPAQLPQIFAGFGLGPFIYWRGNGNEIDDLPSEYCWEAPDGSRVGTHWLGEGYFGAAGLPTAIDAAARYCADVGARLATRSNNDAVLLMHGFDHAAPQPHTAAVAAALTEQTGWDVQRGLLEDFAQRLQADAPCYSGALRGGRVANLLPGVWSTRTWIKLRNRRAETALEAWAEPWAAMGAWLGLADERPALRQAWRSLLQNQAHDSICGCSIDRVHEQMIARYDTAHELADQTTARALERIAGVEVARRTPWRDVEIAVFNASPHPRTDIVQVRLDPFTWLGFPGESEREMALHPWLLPSIASGGFSVGGAPVRVIVDQDVQRPRAFPTVAPVTLEFVAKDVPAFGYRRFSIEPAPPQPDREDTHNEITLNDITVTAQPDGTLTVRNGTHIYSGLFAIEDTGDRGDSYDYDPVGGPPPTLQSVTTKRRQGANGVQYLSVVRMLQVPARLDEGRELRSTEQALLSIELEARLAPGVRRVDVSVRGVNHANDHRVRLLFPTGATTPACFASTFDVAGVSSAAARDWVHPPTRTFPQQGFVSANNLTVVAPGLPEAEVTADGVIAITLLRAVGWLARWDLRTRPQPAGPGIPAPNAQCIGAIETTISLLPGCDASAARDAEIGLRAVIAGPQPLWPAEQSLLNIATDGVVLSALKPADHDTGFIVRLLNPTDRAIPAQLTFARPVTTVQPVRLDESPIGDPLSVRRGRVSIDVPAHALRSLWIR